MSHQLQQPNPERYGKRRRGKMPICRHCRIADATINAFCDDCYSARAEQAERDQRIDYAPQFGDDE